MLVVVFVVVPARVCLSFGFSWFAMPFCKIFLPTVGACSSRHCFASSILHYFVVVFFSIYFSELTINSFLLQFSYFTFLSSCKNWSSLVYRIKPLKGEEDKQQLAFPERSSPTQ